MKTLSREEELALFFQDPRIERGVDTSKLSVLYLLRRDIFRCMGYTKNDKNKKLIKDENVAPIIWPGLMTILSGIDLLGKFYAGNDDSRKVGDRFMDYCQTYMYLNGEKAEAIYQFRNAMIHSFGLYSSKDNIAYYFLVSGKKSDDLISLCSIKTRNVKNYQIGLYALWKGFEKSIEGYHESFANDDGTLQEKFHKMFKLYGLTHATDTYFSFLKGNYRTE